MKIKMFDKVLLKTGKIAFIVDIYNDGEAFEADISEDDGVCTDTIRPEDIEKIF